MMKKGIAIIIFTILVNFSMIVYADKAFIKVSNLDFEEFTCSTVKLYRNTNRSYVSADVNETASANTSAPVHTIENHLFVDDLDNMNSIDDLFAISDAVYEIQLIEPQYYALYSRNRVRVLKTYKGDELNEINVIEPFDIWLPDKTIISQYGNVPSKKDVRYILFLSKLEKAAFQNSFETIMPILGKYEIKTEDVAYRIYNGEERLSYQEFNSYDYLDIYSQDEELGIGDKLNEKYAQLRQEVMSEMID